MMSDRVLFALQNIVGQTVLVQTKTGTVYQGIFKTADINPRLKEVTEIVLHMVYTVHEGVAGAKTAPPPLTAGEQVDGRPFRPRVQPTKEVAIAAADLVQVVVKDFGLLDDHSMAGGAGGDAGDVGTDAGIGKGKMAGLVGRELERWAPGADNAAGLAGAPAPTGVSLELGDGGGGGGGNYRRGGKGSSAAWDQFGANEAMFGVQTSFDENFYTTALDKGNGGISEKEAERIAREIEGMSTTNSHLKEERNQQVGMEEHLDEEDKYSTVMGRGGGGGGFDRRNDATFGEAGGKPGLPPSAGSWRSGPPPGLQEADASKDKMRVRLHMQAKDGKADAPLPKGPPPPGKAEDKKEEAKEGENKPEVKKSTLNPFAKAFTLSASAKEFVPSFGASAKPPATTASPVAAAPGALPTSGAATNAPAGSAPGAAPSNMVGGQAPVVVAVVGQPGMGMQPGMQYMQPNMGMQYMMPGPQGGYIPMGYVAPQMVRPGQRPPGPGPPAMQPTPGGMPMGYPGGVQYMMPGQQVPPGVMLAPPGAPLPQGARPMPSHMPMGAPPPPGGVPPPALPNSKPPGAPPATADTSAAAAAAAAAAAGPSPPPGPPPTSAAPAS